MKRALLIGGGILAIVVAGYFFIVKGRGNPPSNNSDSNGGINLASFDPTNPKSPFGALTRQGIKIVGDRLDSWLS